MPTKTSSFEHYLFEQGLSFYQERLHAIISQQKLQQLSQTTGIKAATLSQYKARKAHPSLPRLAAIAHESGVSLQWLLFGDVEPAKAPTGLKEIELKERRKEFKVNDDVMAPTVAPLSIVQYQPLKPQPKSKIFSDGLYIINTKQGEVLRRIQWQDNDECYLVFGDNPQYKSQLIKTLQVIGKVTAIMVPV
ncbi:helix-turn-helix domain-containing protein [Photobacterium damselae]|uniref:helix-turn-helix domain-containing protein n=1 Tax=Photobacterium damselae TaxID=38293 RepID=UPI004068FD8B